MRVIIEFDTDSAAFDDGYAFASECWTVLNHDCMDVLRKVARGSLAPSATPMPIRDSNGNTIGKVEVRS